MLDEFFEPLQSFTSTASKGIGGIAESIGRLLPKPATGFMDPEYWENGGGPPGGFMTPEHWSTPGPGCGLFSPEAGEGMAPEDIPTGFNPDAVMYAHGHYAD